MAPKKSKRKVDSDEEAFIVDSDDEPVVRKATGKKSKKAESSDELASESENEGMSKKKAKKGKAKGPARVKPLKKSEPSAVEAAIRSASRDGVIAIIKALAERLPHEAAALLEERKIEPFVEPVRKWESHEGRGTLGDLPFDIVARILDHAPVFDKLELAMCSCVQLPVRADERSKTLKTLMCEPAFWRTSQFAISRPADLQKGELWKVKGVHHEKMIKLLGKVPPKAITSLAFGERTTSILGDMREQTELQKSRGKSDMKRGAVTAAQFNKIVDEIARGQHELVHFMFDSASFRDQSIAKMAKVIPFGSLRRLDVSGDAGGSKYAGLSDLIKLIQECPSLEVLDYGGRYNLSGVEALARVAGKTLRVVRFMNHESWTSAADRFHLAVLPLIGSYFPELEEFSLSSCAAHRDSTGHREDVLNEDVHGPLFDSFAPLPRLRHFTLGPVEGKVSAGLLAIILNSLFDAMPRLEIFNLRVFDVPHKKNETKAESMKNLLETVGDQKVAAETDRELVEGIFEELQPLANLRSVSLRGLPLKMADWEAAPLLKPLEHLEFIDCGMPKDWQATLRVKGILA